MASSRPDSCEESSTGAIVRPSNGPDIFRYSHGAASSAAGVVAAAARVAKQQDDETCRGRTSDKPIAMGFEELRAGEGGARRFIVLFF